MIIIIIVSSSTARWREWLIVGSGIHGCHLANRLLAEGEDADGIALLDPHPRALWVWDSRTEAVGMRYLRSPSVHHLGLDPWELQRLRAARGERFGVYQRPSLKLFRRHARAVVDGRGMGSRRIQGWARRIIAERGGWRISSSAGPLRARRVVLAVGPPAPKWPEWARRARRRGLPIQHVLESPLGPPVLQAMARPVIVGAGMSAAQMALSLAERGADEVTLLGPRLRQARFDSDPMWLGPRLVGSLRKTPDMAARRQMIDAGRCPGTVTEEVGAAVAGACARGELRRVSGRAHGIEAIPGGLSLHTDAGGAVCASAVFLATGFDRTLPGGELVSRAVRELGLPVAPCGRPVVTSELEWAPGLYVTGGLAELEIGAAAPNIAGAMRCASAIAGGDHRAPGAESLPSQVALPPGRAAGLSPVWSPT